MATTTLTSKGQLTLPKEVRDRLKLHTGDRLVVHVQEDGTILLQPVTVDVEALYGLLPKPARPVSLEEMERAIQEGPGE